VALETKVAIMAVVIAVSFVNDYYYLRLKIIYNPYFDTEADLKNLHLFAKVYNIGILY
jgi:hypothetical protein